MPVASIRKVLLIGEREKKDEIIKALVDAGIFQPRKIEKEPPGKEREEELEEALSLLSSTLEGLEEFEERKGGLGFFPTRILVTKEEYERWLKEFEWKKVYQEFQSLRERIYSLREEREKVLSTIDFLVPWSRFPFSPQELREGPYLSYLLGAIPRRNKEAFLKEVEEISYFIPVKEERDRIWFILAWLREEKERIEKLLPKYEVERFLPEKLEGLPRERLENLRRRLKEIDKELEKIRKEVGKFLQTKIKIMAIYDHYYGILKEKRVEGMALLTPYTFTLSGWVKEGDLPVLKKILKPFPEVEIVAEIPSPEENPPVALTNRKIFKPFELVIKLYGLPLYFEIDPTPFLAIYFALFLGICLTDGGYGLLLLLFSWIILRKFRVGEGGESLFRILFLSGLFTVVIGILTGGFFGIDVGELPPSLSFLKKIRFINPLKEPLIFLGFCLFLGVMHILTGIFLEIVDKFRKGRYLDALFDDLSWVMVIIGFLFWGGGKAGWLGESSLTGGKILALSGMGILFLFSGRGSKNPFIRMIKGAFSLYGIIQIFGDVLSYSRLLALGLATSVIALVVNIIAQMVSGMPVVGPVLMGAVLVVGHLGNLVINCLSGFIHTARLQFVEFFTKFYEGGGEPFEPLRREGKYLEIKSK